MKEVFPGIGDSIIGLIIADSREVVPDRYVITSKAEDPFVYEGKTYPNPWQNKFWGYKEGDPNGPLGLLCIGKDDLYPQRQGSTIKFYEPDPIKT